VAPTRVVAVISPFGHDTLHAGVPVVHPRPRTGQLGSGGDQAQAGATVGNELLEPGAALPLGQRAKVIAGVGEQIKYQSERVRGIWCPILRELVARWAFHGPRRCGTSPLYGDGRNSAEHACLVLATAHSRFSCHTKRPAGLQRRAVRFVRVPQPTHLAGQLHHVRGWQPNHLIGIRRHRFLRGHRDTVVRLLCGDHVGGRMPPIGRRARCADRRRRLRDEAREHL